VIILTLGRQWRAAAPVFQILVLSAMGQLLFDSTTWLFVSRGQSGRLLRLLFAVSPIIVGSFALGLPFGIKGVALSGSLVLIALLPWVLKFAFHGTTLSLRRLGRALLWPVVASISGVVVSEVAMLLIVPERIFTQLLVVAVGFALAFLLLALVPAVRSEVGSFKDLLSELRTSGSAVPPGA
jgi:PST family polysaccharide transporter